MNSSGAFSLKTPIGTNPADFSLPDRQPKDDFLDPIVSSDDYANGDLHNLYTSTSASFRNQPYTLDWNTERDLADHANQHIINGTFGQGDDAYFKLLEHQTLMYNGMMAGMSFLEAHIYALKVGPKPVTEVSKNIPFVQFQPVGT